MFPLASTIPTCSELPELVSTGIMLTRNIKENRISDVVYTAIKSAGRLFRIYKEEQSITLDDKSISPISPSSDQEQDSKASSSSKKIKKIANLCFFMEVIRLTQFIPSVSFINLGASTIGFISNCFSFAGSTLMVKAVSTEQKADIPKTNWQKVGRCVDLMSYTSSAGYVGLKIAAIVAPILIAPHIATPAYIIGYVSLAFGIGSTTMHLVENRQQIQEKCLALLNKIKQTISKSFCCQ